MIVLYSDEFESRTYMRKSKQFNQFDPKRPVSVNLDDKEGLSVSKRIRSLRGILKTTKRKKSIVDEFLAERRKLEKP